MTTEATTTEAPKTSKKTDKAPKAEKAQKAAPSAQPALTAAEREAEICKSLGFEYEFIDIPTEFADAPVMEISPKDLLVSKLDSRTHPLPADEEMIASVKADGLYQDPLATRVKHRKTGKESWLTVAGKRRREAAEKAGLKVINVKLRRLHSVQEYLKAAGTENLQRENLSTWDNYTFLRNLMATGIPQGQLKDHVQKSEGFVSQYMGVGKLAEPVQQLVMRADKEPFKSGSITVCRELKRVNDQEHQIALATKAVEEKWSPKELKEAVDLWCNKRDQAANKEPTPRGKAAKTKLPDELTAKDLRPLTKTDSAGLLNSSRVAYAKAKANENCTPERRSFLKGQVDGMLRLMGLKGTTNTEESEE